MQRIVAIAQAHEDLKDHDQLRRAPVLATVAGKFEARRKCGCQSPAVQIGLEPTWMRPGHQDHFPLSPDRTQSGHLRRAVRGHCFIEAHEHPPKQIILDLDAADDPQAWPAGGVSSTTTTTVACRCTSSVAAVCSLPSCAGSLSASLPRSECIDPNVHRAVDRLGLCPRCHAFI